jgi:flagellar P-ring protein precursor FlgI
VGRVVAGASIEKDVDNNFAAKKNFRLSLHNPDFTTAARVSATINGELGGSFASARDSATIDLVVPFNYDGNSVELMAMLENLNVNVESRAKVVLNERTGTIVMGSQVTLSPVAISHGDLTIEVREPAAAGKPAASGSSRKDHLAEIKAGSSVSELVKALNSLGVTPKDLTAIFQTLKQVGALQADLEIM